MKTVKAYTYRFYPTDAQASLLARTFGCIRFLWNWALALRQQTWREQHRSLSAGDLSKALTDLKRDPDHLWLTEVSAVPLQQVLLHLDKAFTAFFAHRSRYPRFKKRRENQAAAFMQNAFTWNPKAQTLTLAKMDEPLRIRWSRLLPGSPTSLTISRDAAGRYFVSFVVEEEIPKYALSTKEVGLDLGLIDLLVTSDGWKSGNPRWYRQYEQQLKQAQRAIARKQPGSKNREKARRKVAHLHAKIVDTRIDFLHKLTTKLVREYGLICIESLAVKQMQRNHKLAKSIADASWGEMIRQLRYKCAWRGRTLVEIDRFFPSTKRCRHCHFLNQDLDLSQREWECPQCQRQNNRDENAAGNMLDEGRRLVFAGGQPV